MGNLQLEILPKGGRGEIYYADQFTVAEAPSDPSQDVADRDYRGAQIYGNALQWAALVDHLQNDVLMCEGDNHGGSPLPRWWPSNKCIMRKLIIASSANYE
jgi:hypothetical protein